MYRQSKAITAAQRGAVLPLVAISLVVLLGMAGLALDLDHGSVNKTRLQNALNAAALGDAQTLMSVAGGSHRAVDRVCGFLGDPGAQRPLGAV